MIDVLSSPTSRAVSVTELNRQVRDVLEGSFPVLWVAGEISNFKRYDSGHCYFSLKDAGAQVRCVMFRNRAALLDFQPREGAQVEVRAVVSLYEARGDFQLTIEAMRPAGLGALFEAFEQLKKKLAAEGVFDAARKRPVPAFPRAIGIVTSLKAAALRDVLTTLRRRMPGLPVILYPCAVQGASAANEIAAAINAASARAEVDTLLVCRGGGSIEDLWSFNEEVVARAIAACSMPVVSGVGHETDVTIADFVADVRAATPTAAAELVSPNRQELQLRVAHLQARLARALRRQIEARMQKLDGLQRRLRHPGEALQRRREHLLRARSSLQRAIGQVLEQRRQRLLRDRLRLDHLAPDMAQRRLRLARQAERLAITMQQQQARRTQRLALLGARLAALNPTAVLARGYALVEDKAGHVVQAAAQLQRGDAVRIRFADEAVDAQVTATPHDSQPQLF
ncbi:Exodeoxyribonuclease VII large subunit [Andreprevotia lacus DSM 23236]|jgi:exodeoxyribonuclease VII large subunit|uniref:Exodeoxyribonuclease 7 large subunit n=1 Tax=Andreprevotia lacus DSM 23236 TaxID=1121001 RepID=A0A1W1XKP4_9NEIS|nr:exodeoxyribonuclease VII large subunit [Andreprevotia lacus]SMC24374.1 Exodeoxyribonuclease VII large subunit [Andreprevotia lacus DSM 23236]